MAIRIFNPKHGWHIVYSHSEVERLAPQGWSLWVEPQPIVVEESEDTIEDVKAAYFAKFGKKPHHLMKLENIQKALDDNNG